MRFLYFIFSASIFLLSCEREAPQSLPNILLGANYPKVVKNGDVIHAEIYFKNDSLVRYLEEKRGILSPGELTVWPKLVFDQTENLHQRVKFSRGSIMVRLPIRVDSIPPGDTVLHSWGFRYDLKLDDKLPEVDTFFLYVEEVLVTGD